jgi:hypothetical protein
MHESVSQSLHPLLIYLVQITRSTTHKSTMATTGLAHDTSGLADHANQNSPIGGPRLPIMAGKRRYSGGTICGGCKGSWGRYKKISQSIMVMAPSTQPVTIDLSSSRIPVSVSDP